MTTSDPGALLVDSAMPTYDAVISEHLVVNADLPTTFAAACQLDLLTVHSQPTIEWRNIPAADFPGFDEPGWRKIAANFSILPHGPSASVLTYQCRTVTTDPHSPRRFLRYWRLIRPFVGHIMRVTLRHIRTTAEAPALTNTKTQRHQTDDTASGAYRSGGRTRPPKIWQTADSSGHGVSSEHSEKRFR